MAGSVRIGVIGLGNIGQTYINLLREQAVPRAALTAVAARSATDEYGVPHFTDYQALLRSDLVDAVLVATPTMLHPEMGTQATQQGLHVLMEKPLAMSVAQAEAMLAQVRPGTHFAVMLNQRFHPHYLKLKTLLDDGAIGELKRVSWTMTAWYRPDVYYQVSTWRGTWPGEGGGLLINQCIHNLDVLQWLTGLPATVSAIAGFGKYHAIDVEDEFTATLTYGNGATGTLVASSGEAPGINQLDLVGDNGMLRFDGHTITLARSNESTSEHCRTTDEMFGMPDFESQPVEVANASQSQHGHVLQNFVDAILDGATLLTPGTEGLASLQLANGILQSAWDSAPVDIPIDAARYEQALQARINDSSLRTPAARDVQIDMGKSFR